ncbi:MAG: glycoside hydrolase family 127 protein [Spirosomataceae bacterium]
MKKHLLLWVVLMIGSATTFAQNKDYTFRCVPFTQVKLTDQFWLPRMEQNAKVTIPHAFRKSEETGRVKNFIQAANHSGKFCSVYPFDDSDIYKIIEGASYSLSIFPDKQLDHYVDSLITIVGNAQEPDGYLYTIRTMGSPHPWIGTNRWEKENELSHELYNVGHLYEAATAHYLATGKRNLLDIALKNANLIDQVFGPSKRAVAPGHQVIEIGLVKLYRITGDVRYLNLSKFFIDCRGQRQYPKKEGESEDGWQTGEYWQDHKPVIQQTEATGHAVRAVYLYSGMADVAALTGNQDYLNAISKIWNSAVMGKTYITGGIGTAGDGERFGKMYELPNQSAYCETCAAIGSVFWNQRMFSLYGEAKYFDILERTLYNGLISGIGLDGKSFNYTNPMEFNLRNGKVSGEKTRVPWFGCSCCPTNINRLLPSVPGYIYAQEGNHVYVNLFVSSETNVSLANIPVSAKSTKVQSVGVKVSQRSNYPWDGHIKINVEPQRNATFPLHVRVPGWARNEAFPTDLYAFADASSAKIELKINGQLVDIQHQNGYLILEREWKKGDVVELNLPMEVRRIKANEKVKADVGKVALQRGPMVYCAEFADNNGRTSNLILPNDVSLTAEFKPELLNGLTVLKGTVQAVQVTKGGTALETTSQPFTLIPYYARSNRGEGEMRVWFPTKIVNAELLTE